MQAPAGPTGPPVTGPSGPPDVTGPSGPPVAGPSSDVNPAQFDPLAEIEDARSRRQDREKTLEKLQKKRNSARVNVYLFLALTIVFAGFSFFPVKYGDTDLDPFPVGQNPNDARQWVLDDSKYWNEGGYEDKIWDGADSTQTVLWDGYIPPPLPDMGDTSTVRIDLKIDAYRYEQSTTFKIGIADGSVDDCASMPWSSFDEQSFYHHNESLDPQESLEITMYTQPGQKCLLFAWDEPSSSSTYLATVDIEMSVYWPRLISVPAAVLTFLFAGFAFIGAQRSGRAFKALKYPEGKPEAKVEEEVLQAAEEEQREQIGVPVVEQPENADASEITGPTLAQAAATPVQEDPNPELESSEQIVQQATESAENSASVYTDEQLLGAGWTQEQIDQMRSGQA